MQIIYEILVDQLSKLEHHPIIRFREGHEKEFPQYRDLAYTYMYDDENIIIVYAPKILKLSKDNIIAVLRHEIAHAILIDNGEEHTEQETDDLAEELWGDRISYDHNDIQTLKNGKYPRPQHLPK